MYQRILVPIDGSSTSHQALDEIAKFAGNAQLRLIYVIEEEAQFLDFESYSIIDTDTLKNALSEIGEGIVLKAEENLKALGLSVTSELITANGKSVAALIESDARSWSADLIVIGTHGRTGLKRLVMGSVAEGVVRTANIPVLLIRSN